jgi:hypothetical protein
MYDTLKEELAETLTHAGLSSSVGGLHALMDNFRTNPQATFDPSNWQRQSNN